MTVPLGKGGTIGGSNSSLLRPPPDPLLCECQAFFELSRNFLEEELLLIFISSSGSCGNCGKLGVLFGEEFSKRGGKRWENRGLIFPRFSTARQFPQLLQFRVSSWHWALEL